MDTQKYNLYLIEKLKMDKNKIEQLEEKIWCAHKYLDELGAVRGDAAGEYSIVGRFISYLESDVYQRDKKIEYILNGK